MIKGNQKVQTGGVSKKYVGFTKVEVKAVNPTRSQLNELLGIEDTDDDKPLDYIGEDRDGNKRVRLSFWMYSEALDKYFNYSINITDKIRKSKDEQKTQFINSVCITAWSDVEANLPVWFTKFTDRQKNELGDKEFRPALSGEEELGTLLRAWLGRLDWNDPDTNAMIDSKEFLNENFKSLQEQIGGNYDMPFMVLLGVRTDDEDSTKQYQTVWKNFLPAGFEGYIKSMNFKSDYARKTWARFTEDVEGEYGFTSSYELCEAKEYDPNEDPSQHVQETPTPSNSKY